jgi:anti-sigma B factor antagonist
VTATSERRNDPDRPGASMSVDTVRFDASRANLKVVGELDLATAAPLWAVLQGHLAAGRRYLRLDLSEVTFIDATALSGIARAHRDLLAVRGTLVITGVRARVHRVLRLTGLDEVLFVGGARADDDTFAPGEHADLLAAELDSVE